MGGRGYTRLRRRPGGSVAIGALDAAGMVEADGVIAGGPLPDTDAAVHRRRHDDLPGVDDGRPRRTGRPDRALCAGRRHTRRGASHAVAGDALLRSVGGATAVSAVRGGVEFVAI